MPRARESVRGGPERRLEGAGGSAGIDPAGRLRRGPPGPEPSASSPQTGANLKPRVTCGVCDWVLGACGHFFFRSSLSEQQVTGLRQMANRSRWNFIFFRASWSVWPIFAALKFLAAPPDSELE